MNLTQILKTDTFSPKFGSHHCKDWSLHLPLHHYYCITCDNNKNEITRYIQNIVILILLLEGYKPFYVSFLFVNNSEVSS